MMMVLIAVMPQAMLMLMFSYVNYIRFCDLAKGCSDTREFGKCPMPIPLKFKCQAAH